MPKPVWSNDVSPWARSIGEVDHIVSEFPESAFEDFRLLSSVFYTIP